MLCELYFYFKRAVSEGVNVERADERGNLTLFEFCLLPSGQWRVPPLARRDSARFQNLFDLNSYRAVIANVLSLF